MLGLKDVICPEACAGCCRNARGGLCRTCLEEMPRISGAVCRCCGRPLDRPAASCIDCRSRNFRFDAARQAAPFGPVLRKVVHRFKYSGGRSLAAPLCDLVLEAACGLPGTAQAVTWIPPSPERLRRTGVDHGRILAELVAGSLGKPAVALAARTRRTRPQMRLSPDERRTNVAGAFRATGCTPDSVLLVDDVFTTGYTASEMARALKASGASRVVVATAARSFAVGGPDL